MGVGPRHEGDRVPDLVGDERKELVQRLVALLDRIKGGDVDAPRMIVLRGTSGIGKSRLIRELYGILRAEVIDGFEPYWPDLDRPPASAGTGGLGAWPMRNRKVLGPSVQGFEWESRALPTVLWLGLQLRESEAGQLLRIRGEIEEALQWHEPAMLLARAELLGWDERARGAFVDSLRSLDSASGDQVLDVTSTLALEGLGVAGASVPFASPAIDLSRTIVRKARARRQRQRALTEHVFLGHSSGALDELADGLARRLAALVAPSLPAVIAIEDLQNMDRDLPQLLHALTRPRPHKPVLVLATAWPEAEQNERYARWLRRAEADGVVEVWPVEGLSPADRSELLDGYAPGTDQDVKDEIVRLWSNPYCLELFLTWDEIAHLFTGHGAHRRLDVALADLATYPVEIDQLYEARWTSIAKPVRKALIAAAGTLPPGQPMQPFAVDVVAEVLLGSELLAAWAELDPAGTESGTAEVLDRIEGARQIAWTMLATAGESFREIAAAQVAVDNAQRQVPSTREALRSGVVRELDARIAAMADGGILLDPDDVEHALAARWLLGVSPDGGGRSHLAARFLVGRQMAQGGHFVDALTTLPLADQLDCLEDTDADQLLVLRIRIEQAGWIGESGRTEQAWELSDAVARSSEARFGAVSDITLACRMVHAHWTGICELKPDALALYEQIDVDLAANPSASPLDRARAASGLALWVGENSRELEASALFHAIVEDYAGPLGNRHPVVLAARRGEARFAGEGGDTARAVSIYRELVADCGEWFDPTSPENFEVRRGLARWLLENGQLDEALQRYAAVEHDCQEALGDDHILTLWASRGYAQALVRNGDAEGACRVLRALQQKITVLDPSHRLHTQTTAAIAALGC